VILVASKSLVKTRSINIGRITRWQRGIGMYRRSSLNHSDAIITDDITLLTDLGGRRFLPLLSHNDPSSCERAQKMKPSTRIVWSDESNLANVVLIFLSINEDPKETLLLYHFVRNS
jgi:hypothetical protein